MKSIYGAVTNPESGKTRDIIVTPLCSKNIRDVLIGVGIVLIGVTYIALSSFKNGAKSFETEEYNTLKALDLIKD